MKRFLPIVLLLLPLSSWAASGSVMHHVTDSAAGSTLSWGGVSRQGLSTVVTTDGDVYTMFRNYTGGQGTWLNYWLTFGASDSSQLGGTNGIFGATGGEAQRTLYQFYDSVYAVHAAILDTADFKLRRYNNGVVDATAPNASTSTSLTGDRPGIVHVGNDLIVMHITEDSTGFQGDTTRAYRSNGVWSASTTWTEYAKNSLTSNASTFGTGLRLPMDSSTNVGGSIAIIDMNAEDLYTLDTNGFSALISDAITSTDRQVPGFYRFWAVKNGVRDSILFIWQEDTTTANGAIKARPGHFSYGAGSATGWVWDTASEITVVAAGSFPSKYPACPTATWFPGTDSGMVFWRDIITGDTTVIYGKLISRSGKTYGSDTLIYQMPNTTRKAWGLSASPTAWISGNMKKFSLFMQDSLAASADSARVLFATYDTGDPTPEVVGHSSNTFKNSIAGPQPINRITGPAYVNKK